MRALLLSLLLLPVVAGAQAAYAPALDWRPPGANWTSSAGSASAVLVAPLTSNGPLLAEDAGTVAHVYWQAGALADTKGNAWSMNGTVPQVAANASPFVPGKAGSGPYSDANYYNGGTGQLGNFTGDFSATLIYVPTSNPGATRVMLNKYASGGWGVDYSTTGSVRLNIIDGSSKSAVAGISVLGAVNVLTVGKSGGTCYAKLNTLAAGSVACGTITDASSTPWTIGRDSSGGNPYTTGVIYEMIASTTPYSDALHAARFAAVWGQSALTVTRALDTQTYAANGLTWSAPAATLATESTGAAIWKAATNYAFPSEDISTWNVSGTCTVTANQGPAGFTDLDLVTCTGPADSRYITGTAVGSATQGPVTHCATVASNSGSKVVSVGLDGPDGTWTVTCSRSDGGACTTGTSATSYVFAYATVDTTPIRLCVTGTTTGTAGTTWRPFVHDGQQHATSNVGALFGRSQVEQSAYATPYIPTAAAAVTRNATNATTPLPATGNRFCVSVTATPSGLPAASWNRSASGMHPVGGGSYAAANSWTLFTGWNSTTWGLTIWDGAAATKSWTGPGLAAGPHRLTACVKDGTGSLCVDGVQVANTPSGAGTGLLTTFPSTLYLGQSSGSQYFFDGNVSNVKICKGATKCSECR